MTKQELIEYAQKEADTHWDRASHFSRTGEKTLEVRALGKCGAYEDMARRLQELVIR